MDDNRLLLNLIEDKYQRFLNNYSMDSSDFLSLEQQSLLAAFIRSHAKDGLVLYGGYDDAERKKLLFMPDYTGVTDEKSATEYFLSVPEDCPFKILDVSVPPQEKTNPGHRDYLGALMGEGIKREKIGDIIVRECGAQIIVANEMAEYLLANYRQVGRASLVGKLLPLEKLDSGIVKTELLRISVASPRLDNVVSAVWNISRKSAVEAIQRGIVFSDGVQMSKPDYSLKGGEKLVLRGKGKAIYKGENGTSRKGKTYINVEKYI